MQNLCIASDLNLNTTCRTCLDQFDELSCLFAAEKDSQQTIADILMKITQLEIKPNDEFPQKICIECKKKVVDSYNFKLQAEHNDRTLVNYLKASQAMHKTTQNEVNLSVQTEIKTEENFLSEDEFFNYDNEDTTDPLECKSELTVARLICEKCNLEFESEEQIINHNCCSTNDDVTNNKQNGNNEDLLPAAKTETQVGVECKNIKKERFPCNICNKAFSRLGSLKRHLLNIHEAKKIENLECSVCNKKFKRFNSFQSHSKIHERHHKKILTKKVSKEFECPTCSKKFDAKSKLNAHTKRHETLCPYCGKKLWDKSSLKNHIRRHTGEKPYPCTVCEKKFRREPDLKIHMRTHTGVKPYKCTFCDCAFAQWGHLTLHIRRHTGEKPFGCVACNKCFTRGDTLHKHQQQTGHTGISKNGIISKKIMNNHNRITYVEEEKSADRQGKHIETQMDVEFKNIKKIQESHHKKIVTEEMSKEFECPICSKKFDAKSKLNAHTKSHENSDQHLCPYCGIKLWTKFSLKYHILQHTGEKPYPCTVCEKKFTRGHDLKKHMRTHTGEKPYKCTICDRAFAQRDHLTLHIRRHTGEKPFGCVACNKCFIRGTALHQHQQRTGHTGISKNGIISKKIVINPRKVSYIQEVKLADSPGKHIETSYESKDDAKS